ncbi:MAG: 4Fe-4S binding protein [Deltaproteobacteria bacterium]|nr:4Fe-4S binding protein [Deltaproteobacteria bacterium]
MLIHNFLLSESDKTAVGLFKTGLDKYKKAYPRLGDHNPCNGCKICAKDCPVDAITMVPTENVKAA